MHKSEMRSIENKFKYSSQARKQQPSGDQRRTKSDVVFLGWQETPSGTIALYNIINKDYPLYNSTVAEDTLHKYDLKIPKISCNK